MPRREPIRIEGFTIEDILRHPVEEVTAYIQGDTPLVVSIGCSEILCEFALRDNSLIVVLAHIDGGGEGILRAVHQVVRSCATSLGCRQIQWIATAVNCAKPNLKLRDTLERMNFRRGQTDTLGEAYVLIESLQ